VTAAAKHCSTSFLLELFLALFGDSRVILALILKTIKEIKVTEEERFAMEEEKLCDMVGGGWETTADQITYTSPPTAPSDLLYSNTTPQNGGLGTEEREFDCWIRK
jgi:hypothetical protein